MPSSTATRYLSYDQLRMYAQAAGAADPDTAAAVALAETGGTGKTTAHNIIPPDDSYGPWQINMYGSLGPDRRKKLGITSNAQLYDPAINARAMVMISNGGTNFSQWTTYKDGAYKDYEKGSVPTGTGSTTTAVDANNVTDIPGNIFDGVKETAKAVDGAANWIVNPSNWLRVLYVVAGAAVVLVGLDMLVQNQILGRASKALGGGGAGEGTMKSAGTIAKKVFSPGGKAKAVSGATKAEA